MSTWPTSPKSAEHQYAPQQLAEFPPPAQYADGHAAPAAAARQAKEHGEDLRDAVEAKDTEAFNRAKRTIVPDAKTV
jgi:hypothetical protein